MAFTLNIRELIEEAYERVGVEARSGYQFRTAIRSLNIMLNEWANRGLNMWTIDESTFPTVAGTATYTLPVATIDVIDCVRREGSGATQVDLAITRMSVDTYSRIPNKNMSAKPLQFYINRDKTAPVMTLWPNPDAVYTIVCWSLTRMTEAGADSGVAPDVPFRFVPALVAGLAYYLAMKTAGLEQRTSMLKSIYEEEFKNASDEDRDRSSLMICPARSVW